MRRFDGTDDHHSITASNLGEVANDGKLGVVSKKDDLLVDHESEDTKHDGTAVVELDGVLGELVSSSKSSQPKSMYPLRKSPMCSFPAPATSRMKQISNQPFLASRQVFGNYRKRWGISTTSATLFFLLNQ